MFEKIDFEKLNIESPQFVQLFEKNDIEVDKLSRNAKKLIGEYSEVINSVWDEYTEIADHIEDGEEFRLKKYEKDLLRKRDKALSAMVLEQVKREKQHQEDEREKQHQEDEKEKQHQEDEKEESKKFTTGNPFAF